MEGTSLPQNERYRRALSSKISPKLKFQKSLFAPKVSKEPFRTKLPYYLKFGVKTIGF